MPTLNICVIVERPVIFRSEGSKTTRFIKLPITSIKIYLSIAI